MNAMFLLNDFFSKWPEVASITGPSASVMTFYLLFPAQKEAQKTDVHKQLTTHICATSIFFLRKKGVFVCRQQPALYPQANEELNATTMLWKKDKRLQNWKKNVRKVSLQIS